MTLVTGCSHIELHFSGYGRMIIFTGLFDMTLKTGRFINASVFLNLFVGVHLLIIGLTVAIKTKIDLTFIGTSPEKCPVGAINFTGDLMTGQAPQAPI